MFWLNQESRKKVDDIVITELVTTNAEIASDKETGVAFMIQHKQINQLRLCYKMFKLDENISENASLRHIIMKITPYI